MYQAQQKAVTVLQLISEFQKRGPMSRSQLAELLSLYTSTVSIRTKELLRRGIVRECGAGSSGSRGGRRTTLLELDPDYGLFGGLYLRHRSISASLFTLALDETAEHSLPFESDDPKELTDGIRNLISWMHTTAGSRPLRGIGAAVSSIVSASGRIDASSHFARSLPDFPALLAAEAPGVEITEDNDANLAALLDLNLLESGKASLIHLLVFESIPTIGSGLVLRGRLYRGARGAAGELDEAVYTLKGDLGSRIAGLVRLAGRYIDPEAVFISGELSVETSSRLQSELGRDQPGFPVEFISDPRWVEKGAALTALQKHIHSISGADR